MATEFRGRRRSRKASAHKKREVDYPVKRRDEAAKFLNPGQCMELADIIERLEDFDDLREIDDLEIERVGDFWRLVHSGTSLGPIVAEVYFGCLPRSRKIVVLGVTQSDGTTPAPWHRITRMQSRLDHYKTLE
jgi:hypothetical protein